MESIVNTHVVHIMTESRDHKNKNVQVIHQFIKLSSTDISIYGLCYIECMCEIVISIAVNWLVLIHAKIIKNKEKDTVLRRGIFHEQ